MDAIETTLSPARIQPPHAVQDSAKLSALVATMTASGWQGRAILAYQHGDDVMALTGSHRIAAARAAGLDEVPVLLIADQTVVDSWGDEQVVAEVLAEVRSDQDAVGAALRETLELDADHLVRALYAAEDQE